MAKLDWTQIEGYREDMTADEKLALLEQKEFEFDKSNDKKYISKTRFDQVASELAAANKKLKAQMSVDEQKEAERLEAEEALKAELETLRHERTVSNYKANYLSLGFDESLAVDTAEAMTENDMEKVFANLKKQSEIQKKALTAELMKNTQSPPAGDQLDENVTKLKELNTIRASMGLPEINSKGE